MQYNAENILLLVRIKISFNHNAMHLNMEETAQWCVQLKKEKQRQCGAMVYHVVNNGITILCIPYCSWLRLQNDVIDFYPF